MRNLKLPYYLMLATIFIYSTNPLLAQSSLVKTIYFKPNSFRIEKKYQLALNTIARKLNDNSNFNLKIFSFTDTIGSDNFNEILSQKRATAVFNYLKSMVKLDTTNSYITWLGESADIYDLHFDNAHSQKRCVDILIQFYKKKPEE
ncbi:MAG: OmpA family protein [Sphingobacteriales bacterium]|nr:OmpA family protein [Sphingobacteriales bacterium]MBI3720855.1 OmpA family protein [Sphingobacteriales bacterium]